MVGFDGIGTDGGGAEVRVSELSQCITAKRSPFIADEHLQNQPSKAVPKTISQFARDEPSHQMLPSRSGRPHRLSHSRRVAFFALQGDRPNVPVSDMHR